MTPEYPGCGRSFGVGAYVATLAAALREAGCPTLVLVAGDEGAWRLGADGIPAVRAHGRLPFAVRPALRASWLRTELHAWGAEVVESANWGGLGGPLRGPWRRVVRLSTPTRILPRTTQASRLLRPIHHAWEAYAVRSADVVIADSGAMDRLGRRIYGRASDAVVAHAWAGQIASLPAAGDDVLFVGRLEPRKGVDVLLAAWAALRAHHPDRTLHLVGRDPVGWGAEQIARHGASQIRVHGQLSDSDLAALRTRCALQVVPSRFESFGIVVLEAWAAGLAVVASSAGALPEVVGNAGVLVPAGRSQPLAAALMALLDDPQRRRELTTRGAVRLRSCFSPAGMAAASVAAYRRAIHRRHAGGWTSEPAS